MNLNEGKAETNGLITFHTGGDVSFLQRLRHDAVYRRRFILTVSACFSYTSLGWLVLQVGTALPDLQIIARVDLADASWIFTIWAVGTVVGSPVVGVLLDRFNRMIIMMTSSVCAAVCCIVLPYCTSFPAMVVVRFVTGVFTGAIDTGVNTIVPTIWGPECTPFMQTLYLAYTIGGIFSPLVTEVFMISKHHSLVKGAVREATARYGNITNTILNNRNITQNLKLNLSETINVNKNPVIDSIVVANASVTVIYPESHIHSAFLITGAIVLCTSLPYFIMAIKGNFDVRSPDVREQEIYIKSNDADDEQEDHLREQEIYIKSNDADDEQVDHLRLPTAADKDVTNEKEQLNVEETNVIRKEKSISDIPGLDQRTTDDDNEDILLNDLLVVNSDSSDDTTNSRVTSERLVGWRRAFVIGCVAASSLLYSATEDSLGDFLVTFCLDYLDWNNSASVMITALYWTTSCTGGILGILLVRVLSPAHLLFIAMAVWCTSFTVFLIGSMYLTAALVWIGIAASGVCMVMVVPTLIAWLEKNVCQVNGRVASVMTVGAFVGIAGNPNFIGSMMETYSYICFVYILLGEAVLSAVCYIAAYAGKSLCHRRTIPASSSETIA